MPQDVQPMLAWRTGRAPMDARSDHYELYREAKAAFEAAHAAYRPQMTPGSPEWEQWCALCSEALDAQDAYLRARYGEQDSLSHPEAIAGLARAHRTAPNDFGLISSIGSDGSRL